MKVTITAESSLTISQCGKTVNIVKGDSFVLYGKVFAYKGIIIDVTKYLYVFSVKTEPGLPPIPTYKFIDNVTIAQNGKVAKFTKGQQFKTVSDVVWIADIMLDLTVYAYALTVVSETPVPPTDNYEVTSSSANVTFSPTLPATVKTGDSLVLQLTAATNYTINGVKVNGVAVDSWTPGTTGSITLSDIQENQTIDVETDTVPKYTITTTNENVIVTPSIPSEGLTVGSTVNGTITPKPGFKLLTAKIGSAVLTVSNNEAVITDFIMPAENISIECTTELLTFEVSSESEHVKFTPALPQNVNYDGSKSINVAPATGYRLKSVSYKTANGSPVTVPVANGVADVNLEHLVDNCVIECVTEAIEYEITANGENFTASPTLPATVAHGANFTTLITPTSEFKLTNVQAGSKVIDVGDGTSCTVDLTNVTEDTVITIVTSPATRALDDEVQLP